MIFERFYTACLAQASFGLGDPDSKVAAIVDPRRDVEVYLEWAEANGLRIEHVILTHFHADFLAGHLELRERTGATIHLGARAETEYAMEPLADGAVLQLGPSLRLQALETPGHTPEGICLLVFEGEATSPHAVLTGDTLFLGDVGRPDLMASVGFTAEDLAGQLYDSLHEKILPLPDETIVYPGHGAGSSCGKTLSDADSAPLGQERATNYALQPMTREKFVETVTEGQGTPPRYFAHDAHLNKVERPTLDEALAAALIPLSSEDVVRHKNAGVQILDARDPEAYAAFHLHGSVNVGLGGKYASWCGAVLEAKGSIVLITEPGREREAALRLGRIGFDSIVGYLEGGVEALRGSPELTSRIERIDPVELKARIQAEAPLRILDVRGPGEVAAGAIEGSLRICLTKLQGRLAEVSPDETWVVHCQGGYRSSIAASILEGAGVTTTDLRGGYRAWEAV